MDGSASKRFLGSCDTIRQTRDGAGGQ